MGVTTKNEENWKSSDPSGGVMGGCGCGCVCSSGGWIVRNLLFAKAKKNKELGRGEQEAAPFFATHKSGETWRIKYI